MSISNVTQFVGALRAQLNLLVGTENTQSVSPNSTSEFLSQTVSSLDLSSAEYGTFGRIMDIDFSSEMAKLTKSMILSEAANYVLSGAQLSKSNMVKLLN